MKPGPHPEDLHSMHLSISVSLTAPHLHLGQVPAGDLAPLIPYKVACDLITHCNFSSIFLVTQKGPWRGLAHDLSSRSL
jgi:hypothetical protein